MQSDQIAIKNSRIREFREFELSTLRRTPTYVGRRVRTHSIERELRTDYVQLTHSATTARLRRERRGSNKKEKCIRHRKKERKKRKKERERCQNAYLFDFQYFPKQLCTH
jgi:hypothetical protein